MTIMQSRNFLATAAATMAFAAVASAQVSFYQFTQTTGTYTPITGGTVLGTATSANSLDDVTFAVTLPFTFNYDGFPQTQVQVQTNGHLAFGATSPGTTYTPMSSTAAVPGFVSACGRDLQGGYVFAGTRTIGSDQITNVSANGPIQVGDTVVGTGIPAGTTILAIAGNTITMSANATTAATNAAVTAYGPWSEIRWEVQGTSPNQVFIAQWSNFRRFSTTLATTQDTVLNFQIRLYEDGAIETVYGTRTLGATTTSAIHQVGLRGPTNAFPANINNRASVKGTSDWDTSVAGGTNAVGHPFNSVAPANVITNGLTYRWVFPAGSVIATNTTVGAGCAVPGFNSFYESFADAALASAALTGNSLSLTATPTGYVGTWLPGTAAAFYVTPVAPVALAVGDDGEVAVTPSVPLSTPYGPQATLRVTGNGIIGFGATAMTFPGTNSYTPTAAGFLNSNFGGFYAWHDYNSSEVGSGPVQREEIGGTLYITYNGVENYSTPAALNPSTLQFQLELATGNARIVWVNVDSNTTSTFGSGHLVGVTAPGLSNNPGSTSLATGVLVTTTEAPLLNLAAVDRPVQLAGPSTWNLNATNLPTGLGVDIIGLTDPGILDLSLLNLGLPGCQLRTALDIIQGPYVTAGPHAWSVGIPGGAPALNGIELFTQTAVLDFTVNLALTQTTNGIKGKIGNL
jgi:hypothetical protein